MPPCKHFDLRRAIKGDAPVCILFRCYFDDILTGRCTKTGPQHDAHRELLDG